VGRGNPGAGGAPRWYRRPGGVLTAGVLLASVSGRPPGTAPEACPAGSAIPSPYTSLSVLPVPAGQGGLPSPAPTSQERGLRSGLQEVVDAFYRGGSIPGVSVAVSLPDGSVIALTAGEADTVRHIPMTPESRMLQGSVGKTYFAALAMRLVHEGRLDLGARVSEYLGHLDWYDRVPNAQGITVRHLMTHTSGIMRYEFKPAFTTDLTAEPDKHWRPEELISYVLDEAPSFAPGEGWEYSDTNFILLGMILDRISGRPCYDLIREELLRPLGLENTVPSESRMIPGLIQGYAGPDNPFGGTDEVLLPDGRFVINPQFEWAGGGFASTASDLARWTRAVYTGEAFDPALLPVMMDGVPARLGAGSRYGLGVILRDTPAGPSQGHSGFFPGYLTETAYFPELDVAVALQVNTSVGQALGRSPGEVLVDLAQVAGGRPDSRTPRPRGVTSPVSSRYPSPY
jgi:D-alanyl-D-alanine carboxypeptidase